MGRNIFGVKIDRRVIRIGAVFLSACLLMTGHFLSITLSDKPDGVSVLLADANTKTEGSNGGTTNHLNVSNYHEGYIEGYIEDDIDDAINATGALDGDMYGDSASGADAPRDDMVKPESEIIYVYVTGAVKEPGVYEMLKSSMVFDAIELAGGFTDQADVENVNMVYRIESNAMINVKKKQSSPENADQNHISQNEDAARASDENDSGVLGDAVEIAYNHDGVLLTGGDSSSGLKDSKDDTLININTASIAELSILPVIGAATAEKIISYRDKRRFNVIEDIMMVNGIKQAKFDAIKDLICCS